MLKIMCFVYGSYIFLYEDVIVYIWHHTGTACTNPSGAETIKKAVEGSSVPTSNYHFVALVL